MSFDLSILGVKENIPRVNFMEYTGLLQAPPKWGKTTIASLYPKCILVAVEFGYKAKNLNYIDILKWTDFRNFIDSIEKNRRAMGDSVQTIAIDTVDKLYPGCQEYIVDEYNRNPKTKHKVKRIGNIPHGQGWAMADDEFSKQINRIFDMQLTVLFLTHNKIKTITPEDGDPFDIYVPTMPQRCADIVFPLVDFIINGEKTSETIDGKKVTRRLMRLQGNSMSDSGSRIGSMDVVIKFDTEEEALQKFREAFRGGIEDNIRRSGITRSMDDIEKEQTKEREEKLDKYLNNVEEKAKAKAELTPEERLTNGIKAIDNLIKEKVKQGVSKKVISEIIKQHHTSNNFNSIDDIEVATNVYKALDELKKEDK